MQQRGYFHQVEYFHEVECTGGPNCDISPHYLGPTGGLVKFTICAKVCHVEDRISILFIIQMEFNTPQVMHLSYKTFNMYSNGCNVKIFSNTS